MRALVIPAALVPIFVLAACGGSVSVGGNVSKEEAEKQAKATIAKEVGVAVSEVPPISCPGSLKSEVGATMVCDFGPVDGQMGQATLTVESVEGSTVGFKVKTSAN